MIVPTAQPFSTLTPGQVFTTDGVTYSIVVDATSAVNLATGTLTTTVSPTQSCTLFPAARLVLG